MSAEGLVADVRLARGRFTLAARLSAPPGLTALLGPSGAGKSSLLDCLAGLAPAEGTVRCGGVTWLDSAAGLRLPVRARGVGVVFQAPTLLPHLTALENVAFGASPAEGERWLERLAAAHLAAQRPASLSGGEAQRVALARAFARRPTLLLLDEPFAALDAGLRQRLGDVVRAAVDELGVPCVLVTHDEADAARLADRRVWLEAGRVAREA